MHCKTSRCVSGGLSRLFTRLFKTLLGASLLMASVSAGAASLRTKVIVATEPWAQLMYLDANNAPKGVIADFVNRMNAVQDRFYFELAIYPRLRLDRVFIDKAADVYPLRTVLWTDPKLGLLPTKTILSSGDVYFARTANRYGGRKVFDDLKSRAIAGVKGYHYKIFDNNTDEAHIKRLFNVDFLSSNELVVKFVLAGRADVGIVPEVIMASYLENPETRDQLIIGDFDSRVELSNLVRKDGPISVAEMNAVVDLLIKSGDVRQLKAKLSIRRD